MTKQFGHELLRSTHEALPVGLILSEYLVYTHHMRYGVADSALKPERHITYDDVLFVARTGDYLGPIRDGLIWWTGETPTGQTIEVAGLMPDQDHCVIILVHSMPGSWRR